MALLAVLFGFPFRGIRPILKVQKGNEVYRIEKKKTILGDCA
jgi:hypothetical protein